MNPQKIKQEIGDLLGPKKLIRGKFIFNPAFNYSKKNIWDNSKKREQIYLGKKEGEATSAIRNTVIHYAENLGLVPICELTSDKESTMDQELAKCNKVYAIATYMRRQYFVTIKKDNVKNLPTIRFDCSPQKE